MAAWKEKNYGIKNGVASGGVGFIVIPPNILDRGLYVRQCIKNKAVDIVCYGSSVMTNVKVSDEVIDKIKFPNEERQGSVVVWIRESFYNKPIIIATLSDPNERIINSIATRTLSQEYNGSNVDVTVDAMNTLISIFSKGTANKISKILLKACGSDTDEIEIQSSKYINNICKIFTLLATNSFKLNIEDGTQTIISLFGNRNGFQFTDYKGNQITISNIEDEENDKHRFIKIIDSFGRVIYSDEQGVTYQDGFNNQVFLNEENVKIKGNKINLGEGNQQMVLGNNLKDVLERLIDAINAITVPTSHGPSGTPLNSLQFDNIKNELGQILSKLSNTD